MIIYNIYPQKQYRLEVDMRVLLEKLQGQLKVLEIKASGNQLKEDKK